MQAHGARFAHANQAGFSMVEMLMAAFILAIGILGLTMLQTMSLRAASGSKNLSMAVQLAEQMMDQVELEGRLTYNNASVGTQYTAPGTLTGLQYNASAKSEKYYNIDKTTGNAVAVTSTDNPLFHLTMTQTVAAGIGLSDVTVTVQFSDGISKTTNLPIVRTTTLTRRILHA